MLTLDSRNRKANELNETSHLYLLHDKQHFSLWTTVEVFLSSKKNPSPSLQCQLGTSKIQIQPRTLETHKGKQGLLDLLFLDTQFSFCSLLIYFYSRDWWTQKDNTNTKTILFLAPCKKTPLHKLLLQISLKGFRYEMWSKTATCCF